MRLLILINGLGTGGAERSLAEILPYYTASGIDPEVITLFDRSQGVQETVRQTGVPVTVLSGATLARKAARTISLVRQKRPDLILTTIFEADMVGRVAGRITGLPVMTSLVNRSYAPVRHNDPHVSARKLALARRIESASARRLTTHFHAITQAVKQAAINDLRIEPQSITVVPRGRNGARIGRRSEERRTAVREAMGVAADTPLVLTVGRMEFQKGQVHLINALPEIRRHLPEAEVWIAGRRGHMSPEIESAVDRFGLKDCVRLLGHRDDVPDLLVASDVLVFPSLYEGLGGILIEAMATETPIITSDLPATREVTNGGACATLVPAGHPEPIAAAVLRHFSSPTSQAALTEVGRSRFEQHYSIDVVGPAMVHLLSRVASMNPVRHRRLTL